MLLIYCNEKFARHEIKENIGVKYLKRKILIFSDCNAFHHGFAACPDVLFPSLLPSSFVLQVVDWMSWGWQFRYSFRLCILRQVSQPFRIFVAVEKFERCIRRMKNILNWFLCENASDKVFCELQNAESMVLSPREFAFKQDIEIIQLLHY